MTDSLFTADQALVFELEMSDWSDDRLVAFAHAHKTSCPQLQLRLMSEELEHRLGWDMARLVLAF